MPNDVKVFNELRWKMVRMVNLLSHICHHNKDKVWFLVAGGLRAVGR